MKDTATIDIEAIDEIQNKLTVITDLFNFYTTIEDYKLRAEFRTRTYNGIYKIVDDRIDKLEALKNE